MQHCFFLYHPVAQHKDLFKQNTWRTRDTHSTKNDITHWFWCIFTQWQRHFINLTSHLLNTTNCLLVMVWHFTGLNDQRKHSAPTHLEANCIKMQHSLAVTLITLNHNELTEPYLAIHSHTMSSWHPTWPVLKIWAHTSYVSNSVMQVLNIIAQLQQLMELLYSWRKKASKQYVPRKHKKLWIKSTSNKIWKDMHTTLEYLVKTGLVKLLQSCNWNRTYCKDWKYMDNFFSSPVNPLGGRPGNGQRSCFSTSWSFLFWRVSFS